MYIIFGVLLTFFGSITSFVYLSAYNKILNWHTEQIRTLRFAKSDIEHRFQHREMGISDEQRKPKSKLHSITPQRDNQSRSPQLLPIPENDDDDNISDHYGFLDDEQSESTRDSRANLLSENNIEQVNSDQEIESAKVFSSPGDVSNDFSGGHKGHRRFTEIFSATEEHEHATQAQLTQSINYYETIIRDVHETMYPPILFGFEYSPLIFTTLKGYLITVAASAFVLVYQGNLYK